MAKYPPLKVEIDYKTKRYTDALVGLKALSDDMNLIWDGMPALLADELKRYLTSVADSIAQKNSGPWPGGTTPVSLSSRSGALVKSVVQSVKVKYAGSIDSVQGEIGGNFYAVVQEYGAIITVKKAKWLTIPLPAALDSRGVPLKKSAKDWDHTFIARSKKGNLLIFRKVGASKIVPLYALKKSVKIPPRLNMRTRVEASLPYFVDRAVDRMLKALIVVEQ